MKLSILAVCICAIALGACRREEPYYEPMKLGAQAVTATSDAAHN
jgi:hypothetical protein